MKFDKTKLKAGDTCVLRCGGRLAWGEIQCDWDDNGRFKSRSATHPFDIIDVIPAPEPVVEVFAFGYDNGGAGPCDVVRAGYFLPGYDNRYKITITDGKPKIERVE